MTMVFENCRCSVLEEEEEGEVEGGRDGNFLIFIPFHGNTLKLYILNFHTDLTT
jgi:hypothetical protein